MNTRLLDFPVHLVSQQDAVDRLIHGIQEQQTQHVVTLNPEMIMQSEHDAHLERILKHAELVIPDGSGVVWALKLFGHKHVKRLPGIELSEALLDRAAQTGLRVALIGASPEVIEQAATRLKTRFTGLNLVYTHHGFFKSGPEEDKVVSDCAATQPQVILVGLGVPRQELWIDQYRERFAGAVLVGVGGSFDVWSGLKKRAPDLFLRLHLEWLYRITSEPWRIQRVYKRLPLFVVKVLQHRFAGA